MPSEQYKEEESRIQKALESLQKNPKQKIAHLAREFNVDYHRLRRRTLGSASQLNRRPAHKRLTDDQESAIIIWIDDLDDRGLPPTVHMIQNYAENVLQNMHPNAANPPKLGDRWVHRFLKRLPPAYKIQKQKTIDPKRHLAEDPNIIQAWFDRLEIALDKNKITPQNYWNFDESGFQIGQGGDEEVVTKYPETIRSVPSSSSRELVTVIEGINAAGSAIPLFLIFTGKVILESWFQYLTEDEWKVTITESGFSNNEIAYEWLQHFDQHTREQAGNNWRLLTMDSHTAHLTREFMDYCLEHKIVPFRFPAHTTHLLQPLDGMPFLHYKRIHRRAINEQAHLGGYFYDKIDFCANIGRLTQAHIKEQQQEQIDRLQTLNERKSAKKSRRQVQVGGVLTVQDANRAIKKRATAEEKKAERKRLKELREAPLGSMPPMPPPLSASDEAAIQRNTLLNLIEQVYPRAQILI
uniref:Tigger transposable element-derived protein 1 n=1 Tax=Talaromyces marneffei PM1 TaxID=1077442 RepID=A0A093V606_TALMA